jgi:hypothetical protein
MNSDQGTRRLRFKRFTLPGSIAMTSMKDRIHKTKDLLGGYLCVIPSAVATQALAATGADFLVIDQEHAPTGAENLHAMIAATAGTPCSPRVRVAKRDEGVCEASPRCRRRRHHFSAGADRSGSRRMRVCAMNGPQPRRPRGG